VGVRDDLWMPSKVRGRADEFPLWEAFRRYVGNAWTGREEDVFIAGWDAAMKRAEKAVNEAILNFEGDWDERQLADRAVAALQRERRL
jgi:hypothetical protein